MRDMIKILALRARTPRTLNTRFALEHRYVAGVKNASIRELNIEKSADKIEKEIIIGRIEDDFLLNVLEYRGEENDKIKIKYQDGVWRHNKEKDVEEK